MKLSSSCACCSGPAKSRGKACARAFAALLVSPAGAAAVMWEGDAPDGLELYAELR